MLQKSGSLPELLVAHAARTPKAVALRHFDKLKGLWCELTWADYEHRVRKLAGWLQSQGIGPGDRVAILSHNRPEWLVTDLAILAIGAVSVPIYATSAGKDIDYILGHVEAKALVAEHSARLQSLANVPPIVLVIDGSTTSHQHSFSTVFSSDVPPLVQIRDCAPDELATIIYTSGTTGLPKGVVHTRSSLGAVIPSVRLVLEHGKSGPDRFLSFLPLSHVAERVLVEIGSLILGAEVCFARSVDSIVDDMQLYPPTILLCVPRLWEKVHERIIKGLATVNPVRRGVFSLAHKAGRTRIVRNKIIKARDASLGAKIADKLVGTKLKTKLGMQNVRIFVTGSAPTRRDILEFFGAFGIFIREVYGLTENLCLGVVTSPDEITIGSCGQPFVGNEVRIAPDGEIIFRAPWTFQGYYKNPEATAEVLIDNWFHTGDLGSMDHDRRLSITGRKKELLKTSTGKYVAPVPIEAALCKSGLITEAMVVGDNQKHCIALVVISSDLSAIARAEIESRLDSELERLNADLPNHEAVRKLAVLKEGFSIESGLLTPTLKIRRKAIASHYERVIAETYSSRASVYWE